MSKTLSALTAATTPLAGTEKVYLVQGGNSRMGTTGSFYIPGGTDVAVVDGGTGSSTAAGARTNLGLVIGTDIQAYSANLASWGGVTRASGYDTFAATPTSANLRALLSDEVGTGAAYFVGGALGTPASGVATNLTGLPISTGVAGLGSGVATFLATATSANLAAALTDEVGTGSAVFESAIPLVTPGGRLTLTSGVAVTTSDVTGATSIYYTPAAGDRCPIYNGTRWTSTVFTELTLALDPTAAHTGYQQSGKIFDLFVINDSGTIRLVTGPAWSSDTARGTGAGTTELQLLNGLWTNANSLASARFGSASGNTVAVAANQATYAGSFRATADGQASDTNAIRHLFNSYNQSTRTVRVFEATASWTYSTAVWRQANGAATNQIDMLSGLGVNNYHITTSSLVSSTATGQVFTALSLDSTTAAAPVTIIGVAHPNATGTITAQAMAVSSRVLGLGRHYVAWLEYGLGSGTQTWFGTNGSTINNGLTGWVIN